MFIKKIKENKRYLFSFIIVLVGLLSLLGGTSYAILKGVTTSTNEQVVKAGNIELVLTESFEELGKGISIMEDADGLLLDTTYDFNIKNVGAAPAKYDLKLVSNPPSNASNVLDTKYIKVGLEINGEEHGPMTLEEVNNTIDSDIIYEKEIVNFKLRLWLDSKKESELTDFENYKAYLKLELAAEQRVEYMNTNVPNKPVLDTNMIPVYYDESAATWKKADINNSDNNWYNYDEKKWANSVTVTSSTRSTYKSASVGTEVKMDDILTMQVWIPRYKYKIWNYNADGEQTSEPQEIQIMWENGTAKTGQVECKDNIQGENGDGTSETCTIKAKNEQCGDNTCNGKTYTHPAFTFGNEEIPGFWMGKFELTGTISDITVKPNLISLTEQTVSSFETNIMNMKNSGNKYGFNTNTDTHMIKNSEWGAVAYLSHSKYGTCTNGTCVEVSMNGSDFTGGKCYYVAPVSNVINNENKIKTLEKKLTKNTGSLKSLGNTEECVAYNTLNGKKASTTQNIYGVYDMSGGASEYTMANMVSNDGTIMMSGYKSSQNSGYTGKVYDVGYNYTTYIGIDYPNVKYYDRYSYSTSSTTIKRSKLGDGIKEVKKSNYNGWYSNNSDLARSYDPWFVRSGDYYGMAGAGVFSSLSDDGNAGSNSSSRPVITP